MAISRTGLPEDLTTEQVIDLIFKDPAVKHGLTEFDDLGKPPHEILNIYPGKVTSGRAKGEVRYGQNSHHPATGTSHSLGYVTLKSPW